MKQQGAHLVTPKWLSDCLKDGSTVVLDASLSPVGLQPPIDTRARYAEGHIPGALFLDIEDVSDHSSALPHMLPSAEDFSRRMSAMGISADMRIVVYEQGDVFAAPRLCWTRRSFGATNVQILDGGLRAWIAEGLALSTKRTQRAPCFFNACLDTTAVDDFAQVQGLISRRAQILDARSSGRFSGTMPEPRAGLSSGHMPGAINVPYLELIEGGRFKSADRLREIFVSKSVNLDLPISTTCGSGITAAVVSLGLEIAGARQVSLYDGSWTEYAQHPQAVIVKS